MIFGQSSICMVVNDLREHSSTVSNEVALVTRLYTTMNNAPLVHGSKKMDKRSLWFI